MVVKDRLQELHERMASAGSDSKGKKKEKDGDRLQVLLDEVKTVDDKIAELRKDVDSIQKELKDLLFTPGQKREELRQLEKTADHVYSASLAIQKEIKTFKTRVQDEETKHLTPTQEAMVSSHLDRLGMQVVRVVNDLKTAQADYIDKTRNRNQREVEIVNGGKGLAGASHHDPNDPDNNVFVGNFLEEMQAEKLKLLEDRTMEIQKLESSVVEVNRLFKEVNQLVEEQGEGIDRIEDNVEKTVLTVVDANKQLDQAEENQKKARRKKICCIGVIVAAILVVVVIIVIIIVSQNSGE